MYSLYIFALAACAAVDIMMGGQPIHTITIGYFTIFEWLPMLANTPESTYEDV